MVKKEIVSRAVGGTRSFVISAYLLLCMYTYVDVSWIHLLAFIGLSLPRIFYAAFVIFLLVEADHGCFDSIL